MSTAWSITEEARDPADRDRFRRHLHALADMHLKG